jgi:hypothetical protein
LIVVMKINVAESVDEMDEDFSAAIRQMEKLARPTSIEGWAKHSCWAEES